MASVHLDFVPPDVPNLEALVIYESPMPDGSFAQIEEITPVGAYPNYISEYTTINATAEDDWFAIRWRDNKGWYTDWSEPIQGGTTTAVGELISRILQRDSSIDEDVARQESEAAIERVFNVTDPYSILDTQVTARQYSGMVLLAMATAQLTRLVTAASGDVDAFTAGLVSIRSSSSSTSRSSKVPEIESLLKMANRILGLSFSVVMLMEEIQVTSQAKKLAGVDMTRLIYELE